MKVNREKFAKQLLEAQREAELALPEQAKRTLRRIIELEQRSVHPDPFVLSVAIYALSDLCADDSNISQALLHSAAEVWLSRYPDKFVDILWYSGALKSLQREYEELLRQARDNEQDHDRKIA